MSALTELIKRNSLLQSTGESLQKTFEETSKEFEKIEPVKPVVEEFNIEPLKRLGKGIFGLIKTIIQGTARSGGTIILSSLKEDQTFEFQPTEGTLLRKAKDIIFGEEPLRTVGGEIKQTEKLLEGLGLSEKIAKTSSFFITPFFLGLDFTTGGGKGKVVRELSKLDDVVKISKVLRKLKVPENILDDVARDIAKVTDIGKIDELLTGIKTTTKVSEKAFDDTAKVIKKAEKKSLKTGQPISRVVRQNFNLEKLNITDEAIQEVTKRLSAIGLDNRTVRTLEDIEQAAQELGHKGVSDLLKDVSKNRITAEEVVALRNEIRFLSLEKVKKTNELEELKKTAPEKIIEGAKKELGIIENRLDSALSKLVKGGTEAGRAVAAFRIQARQTLAPDYWFIQAKKQLKNREFTQEMQDAITKLIGKKDIAGLANFVSMLRKPSFAEKAVTLWKAGLLTSPTTHLANIGGNLTMRALLTASDVPSTGFDILFGLFTGKRTVTINPRIIAAQVKGFKAGAKDAKRFLKTGIYRDELLSKYDLPKNVNYGASTGGKILNGYTQSIFRSLGAEDVLFRQAAISETMEKQAIIIAKNEGLKGKVKLNRIKELLIKPTNEMQVNAIDAAEYATFQNKNALANMISSSKTSLAKAAGSGDTSSEVVLAVTEFLAPFVRTPTNIAARIADFSPIGFIRGLGKTIVAAKKGEVALQQKQLVEELGRGLTGTGIIAFGAMLAREGIMTGNAPANRAERADFYAQGKQANSILIAGRWFQLNRVSPFGNLLGLGANFEELSKDFEGGRLAAQTAFSGVKGLTEQTFLKGISGGLKVLTEPERSFGRFLQQGVASTVPSVVGRFARTIDPRLRIPEGVLEAVQARLPVLSKGVPVRRDVFGQPVRTEGGRGKFALIDPFNVQKQKDDPVLQEAQRIGYTVGMPSQRIRGVKLTNAEYSVYQKVQGKILRVALEKAIASPQYQKASAGEKKEFLEDVERDVRRQINDIMFPALMIERYNLPKNTHPEILTDIISELNSRDEFKKKSEKEKGEIIRKLLDKISVRN